MTTPEHPEPTRPDALPGEEELRQALEGLRPDPADFRAGVERRIAEREEREEGRQARFTIAPARLRWAASILPPGVIGGAMMAAGATGKKLGLKAIPGLMAIPAVATVMVILTFFGALRGLKPAEGPAGERVASEKEAMAAWWKRNRIPAALCLALFIVLGILRHPEILTLVLLVSMVAVTAQLAALGKAGFGDRERIGALGSQMLFTLAYLWFMLRDVNPMQSLVQNPHLGPVVLCLGGVACLALGGQFTWTKLWSGIWHPERRMLYPDPVTTFCLRSLYGGLALGAAALLLFVFWSSTPSAMTLIDPRWRLERAVNTFDQPIEAQSDWYAFGHIAEYLQHEGSGSELCLDRARSRVQRALVEGTDLDPLVLASAVQVGLATPAEIADRLPRERARELLGGEGELYAWEPRLIRLLQVCGEWSEEERAHLALRVAATWPEVGAFGALGELRDRAELLDLLGHGELAEERASEVAEALRVTWCGTYDESAPGCFVQTAESAHERAHLFMGKPTVFDIEPTQAAVDLMMRFGVPDGIDPERVRGATGTYIPAPLGMLGVGGRFRYNLGELARVQMHEQFPPQPGGVFGFLIRRRIMLGALLLVALCVIATARAPRPEGVA